MFHWAARWGRHSLPIQGIDLGMKVMIGLHLHLNSFPHILWTAPRYCNQCEILLHYYIWLIGIWNDLNNRFNMSYNKVLLKIFLLTSSTDGSDLTGLEQGSHCHIVCPGEVSHLMGHLWSPRMHETNDAHSSHNNTYPCLEYSAGWQCHWAVRLCRCSPYSQGSYLDRMVRWKCQMEMWTFPHILQALQSYISLPEPHLMIHISAGIPFYSQRSWKWICERRRKKKLQSLISIKMLLLSPDSQVILRGLHEIRDSSAIFTESSHKRRFLRIAISQLNVIWC